MSIVLPPEMYRSFQKWQAKQGNKKICVLDICAVSVLKVSPEKLKESEKELLEKLKSYDQLGNKVVYFCALMEKVSDMRGKLSYDQLKEKIVEDILLVKSFFKKATVLEGKIDKVLVFYDSLFQQHIELDTELYHTFLKSINNDFKLYNPVSPKDRLKTARKIIDKALEIGVNPRHLTVSVALACLYRNNDATAMCKFKQNPDQFDHTNVYADIMLLQRFARIKYDIEIKSTEYAVRYLTGDNPLKNLSKYFEFRDVNIGALNLEGQLIKYTVAISWNKLLTEASEIEANEISGWTLEYIDTRELEFEATVNI